jgi:hypothetical protein
MRRFHYVDEISPLMQEGHRTPRPTAMPSPSAWPAAIPATTEWQRDLSVSYVGIGVLMLATAFWAERAAKLGWDAVALFHRPLDRPGSAGLLGALNGGRLVELHRDWSAPKEKTPPGTSSDGVLCRQPTCMSCYLTGRDPLAEQSPQ